jgi:ComF family protein
LPIPSRCYKCHKQTTNFAACKQCRRTTVLKHVWIATEYTSIAKQLVQDRKYELKRPAVKILASYMQETLPHIDHNTVLVSVPTASKRVRQRGFDHALLITKALASSSRTKYCQSLKRWGQSRQVGAKRTQRLKQLEGAFWIVRPSEIKGRQVVLVDDVLTTGASLEIAARVLKEAGATSVDAIVFAQAK